MAATLFALLAALFLGMPVAAQQNPITNSGFEQVDAKGMPVGWELLGPARVETGGAHSGQRALHLVRTAPGSPEVGLNRSWAPNSKQQGTMLSQRKGGIRFWYKAVSATPKDALTVQVIPMTADPLEASGAGRTVWRVPARHIGDGQWHQGAIAYDYADKPDVKWVHVGARVFGQQGDLWLDDFEWVAQVGPVLQLEGMSLRETAGKEGEDAALVLSLRNAGDQPLPGGKALLSLPAGLKTPAVAAETPALAVGATAEVTWPVSGRRVQLGQKLSVVVDAGSLRTEDTLELAADLSLARLQCERMILKAGETILVRLLANNAGTAISGPLKAQLDAPASLTVTPATRANTALPGTESEVAAWRVTAKRAAPLLSLRARIEGVPGEVSVPLVVADRLPTDLPTSGPVTALVQGDQAVVATQKTRLILARGADGYGVGALQVRGASGWRTVAHLPRLGLLAAGADEVVLAATKATPKVSKDRAGLVLEGAARVGGQAWNLRWELTALAGEDHIGFSLTATPQGAVSLKALEGPMLYAGEGTAVEREDAIVPGIEWLVRGEESSNSLDFTPDHPDRVRYVPHPVKITVPAVGMRFGDTTVGLLWDVPAKQPSYAQTGAASLVFASPNRFEGHDNHLMGLFLPAVGRGVLENERRASAPLPVAAGQALTLRAELLAATGASDSLVALDRWYDRHGFPEPLPYPRKDPRGEVTFSLQAYFKDRSLWNAEWGKWKTTTLGGHHTRPTEGPALDLLRGAQYLKEGAVVTEARRLAAEVLGGDARSLDHRIQHRANPEDLRAWAGRVRARIASQHEDGTWRFSGKYAGTWPEKGVNYKVLGAEGAPEVGLTAPPAIEVLEFALLIGDPEARAAGLKALEAMKQFRVPRAAQVWEVPVHTPDILASGKAVSAYLAGYKLTGDAQYLREAIYWARTGLPFVYVWNEAHQPSMMGATIPVFGGTHYRLSWLAVAVQWNGLAYGDALMDLAAYDRSFPWMRVAENMLRSGMYQQATEGDRFGQWPDALNYIPGRKGPHGSTPPCFQPATLLRQLSRVEGQHPLNIVPVRKGSEQIALRGTAGFRDAAWNEGGLRFTAVFTPPQRGSVEVVGVSKPRAVLLNGKPLAERADLWREDLPGWTWHESVACLEVRVVAPGTYAVEAQGLTRLPLNLMKAMRKNLDFRFDKDAEGWVAAHDLAPLTVDKGALVSATTGGDPYMTRDGLFVPGQAGDELVLRLSVPGGTAGGSIFWGTEAEPGFSPRREIAFPFVPDANMREVRVPVGKHASWAGQTITSLRVDPPGGKPGLPVRIESIRLQRAK